MLGKLFGKKSGYYLELSEEEIAAIPVAPQASAAPAPVAIAATTTPAKAAVKAPATDSPAKATKESQAKGKKQKTAEAAAPAAPAQPPLTDPLELIYTALATTANQSGPAPEKAPEPTFSSDYLMPAASSSRRRPGPSMSPFKSMVKGMKRTRSGF